MFAADSSPFSQEPSVARPAPPLPSGVRRIADCHYVENGHSRNRLDLYLPEDPPESPPGQARHSLPVILWIHGGGWIVGDKAGGPAIAFAARGFAVAAMNYRYSRHATFPAQLHDCKAAVRWLRANAGSHGLDSQRIGVWGASAGGHLAAMLGLTAGTESLEGALGSAEQSSAVQAVVDWFGPTDFLTLGPGETRTQFLGGDALANPEKARAASPLEYVTNRACPFFIVHGDHDPLVPYAQSQALAEALQQTGVETTFITIAGGRHGGSRFSRPEELARIEAFFSKHLKAAL